MHPKENIALLFANDLRTCLLYSRSLANQVTSASSQAHHFMYGSSLNIYTPVWKYLEQRSLLDAQKELSQLRSRFNILRVLN